ncbi:hypothetical protein N9841_01960 [Akkermansiaceae bacterium]|nr:hypothetical protein [Akkermansiaceae bacterium]
MKSNFRNRIVPQFVPRYPPRDRSPGIDQSNSRRNCLNDGFF